MGLILGIDPGGEGAAVSVDLVTGKVYSSIRFAKATLPEIADWLTRHGGARHAYLEQVGSMPGQGVASSFKFGVAYGQLQGLLTALQIPFTLVRPQVWQKGLGLPPKSGVGATKHKQNLKQLAQQRHPELTKMTNDLADAVLIADYGRAHC
jgi:crossover junction endodeoxyribonuclease RuvC